MKWVLIIGLVTIIMIIALSVSRQYREKYEFYTHLKIFLEDYKVNISFKQSKIHEFLVGRKETGSFDEFIAMFKDYLKTNTCDLNRLKLLESEEKQEIEKIIKSLGNYDLKNELLQLEGWIATVNRRLEKATEDKIKLCPMILKLSLLFAIGIAILLL